MARTREELFDGVMVIYYGVQIMFLSWEGGDTYSRPAYAGNIP